MCDDDWDDIDAGVVCRMYGFHFGTAKHKSTFGVVEGPYRLENVRCSLFIYLYKSAKLTM